MGDGSFVPLLSMNYALFQGITLNLTGKVPLDRKVLSVGAPGELGPETSGTKWSVSFKLGLRF
jgi:hypothetical protein